MCGLFFKISESPDREFERYVTQLLFHRGPDDQGAYFEQVGDRYLSFIHTRLSILDVSMMGHQPFRYKDTLLIFNGEIYNYIELREELRQDGYTFETGTDTEVITAMYDKYSVECFAKFLGMWAIILYDAVAKEVVISRDRFGVKPLYYAENDGDLIMSSEIKPVKHFLKRPALNRDVVSDFLREGVLDNNADTFFDGICRFPPASYARISLNKKSMAVSPNVTTYYRVESAIDNRQVSVAELEAVLKDAVDKHLRSDVPLGFCLSGGLDSSTLLKLSVSSGQIANAMAFNGYSNYPGCDERANIELLAKTTKFQINYVSPSDAEIAADLMDIFNTQEEPFLSTSVILQWYVFKMIGRHGVKVVLDGQGSDEIFAGYPTFYLQSLLDNFRRAQYVKLASVLWRILRYYSHLVRDGLYNYRPMPRVEPLGFPADQLKHTLIYYIKHRSLPALLRYEDKNSMRFSVESRVPYLDHRLVDLALSCDSSLLINGGRTKSILREAMGNSLPRAIIDEKRKIGFAAPEEKWVQGLVEGNRKEFLAGIHKLREEGLGHETLLEKLHAQIQERSRVRETSRLWRYYCIVKWRKAFKV
ncbi:MAG: asparagine synthase (glutamine-hydrolyzing) [Acidobacteria bacterium]|nr:asparagine synthase (glutamine-hydrolyzing) [Acidobacteriota bacterium]MBI3658202.1 asparagine synthase (glutamine-hydrolyzing) [Acidobacteriota bacterium]